MTVSVYTDKWKHANVQTIHKEESRPGGFRPGDSTINQVLSITTEIYEAFAATRGLAEDKNLIKTGQTIILDKPKDIYFIGDDNFIAITKYNRSHFYAKAVYDLSLEFK